MGTIITITNQKGGVGKTTTTLNIAYGLREHKKKVLLIDLDAQGNLSLSCNTNNDYSIMDVMQGTNIKDAIGTTTEGIDIIESDPNLIYAEKEIKTINALKEQLDKVKDNYDYILIDTPPAMNVLTTNALVSADKVIIPTLADLYSLQGLTQLHEQIKVIQTKNPNLKIQGILINKNQERLKLSKNLEDYFIQYAKKLDTKVFKARIRESVVIRENQVNNTNLFKADKHSKVKKDYEDLIKEIIKG